MRVGKGRWHRFSVAAVVVALLLAGCDDGKPRATLADAQSAFDAGDPQLAATMLKALLSDGADNAQARVLLGRIQLESGEPVAAEASLRAAKRLGAEGEAIEVKLLRSMLAQGRGEAVLGVLATNEWSSLSARLLYAQTLGALGRLERARTAFEALRGEFPDNADVLRGFGRLLLGLGDFDSAYEVLTQAAKAERVPRTTTLELIAQSQLARGKVDEASSTFEALIERSPKNVRARLGRARIMLASNDVAKANAELDALDAELPGTPVIVELRAMARYRAGKHDDAAILVDLLLSNNRPTVPRLALAIVNELARNRLDDAVRRGDVLLGAFPENRAGRRIVAAMALAQRNPQRAADVLAPLLSVDRKNPQTYLLAGRAHLALGETDIALGHLRKAAELAPKDRQWMTRLAIHQFEAGANEKAQANLESLLTHDANDVAAQVLRIYHAVLAKDDNEALRRAMQLASEHPRLAPAHNILGTIMVRGQSLERARTAFEKAVELDARYVAARVNLGRLYEAEGNQDKAKATYDHALSIDDANADALLGLARLTRDREESIALLERALADEDAFKPRVALAEILLKGGETERALVLTKEAADAAPHVAGVRTLLGRVQLIAGRRDEGHRTLETVADERPNLVGPRYLLGLSHLRSREYPEARVYLDAVLDINPTHEPGNLARAQLALGIGEFDDALARVARLDQTFGEKATHRALEGDVRLVSKDYAAAALAYERAYSLAPSGEHALRLFNARRLAADTQGAEAALTAWLAGHPNDYGVRSTLADFLQSAGKLGASARHYEALQRAQPDRPAVLNNLAWVYHLLGRPEARSLAERAVELTDERGEMLDTLGWILFREGSHERALGLLRRAHAARPEVAAIAVHYAAVLEATGSASKAIELLEPLVSSGRWFPEHELATDLLKRLNESKTSGG